MAAPRKKTTVKKPVSGTMGERLGEAKNRPYKGTKGGAVTKVTKPRATGRQYSGDTIKMKGPQQGVTKPKTVPLGDRPKLLSGPKAPSKPSIAGTLIRGAYRAVGGPAVMLVSMTVPAGEGSDRPSGPLFSPSKNRAAGKGNPKTVNPYRSKEVKQANPGLSPNSDFIKQQIAKNKKAKDSKASSSGMTGNGRLRPEVKKNKSAIQEAFTLGNGAQGKAPPTTSTSAQAPKAAAPKKPAFKGNWTGAAATEMQKRGGAKIKRPNLLSLFRKKK